MMPDSISTSSLLGLSLGWGEAVSMIPMAYYLEVSAAGGCFSL